MKTKRKSVGRGEDGVSITHLRKVAAAEVRALPWRLEEIQKIITKVSKRRWEIQRKNYIIDRELQNLWHHIIAMQNVYDKKGLCISNGVHPKGGRR